MIENLGNLRELCVSCPWQLTLIYQAGYGLICVLWTPLILLVNPKDQLSFIHNISVINKPCLIWLNHHNYNPQLFFKFPSNILYDWQTDALLDAAVVPICIFEPQTHLSSVFFEVKKLFGVERSTSPLSYELHRIFIFHAAFYQS